MNWDEKELAKLGFVQVEDGVFSRHKGDVVKTGADTPEKPERPAQPYLHGVTQMAGGVVIVLEGEQAMSGNKFYSQGHWRKRYLESKRVHELVAAECRRMKLGCFTSGRVDILVVCYYKNNAVRVDSSNVLAKCYEDGLVKAGLLLDDNFKYVRTVATRSELDRKNPRLEIHVTLV